MNFDGNLDLDNVREVERMALTAWPALETIKIGGWLARYAAGITRRANSIWPNEIVEPGKLEAMFVEVENFYRERNLPARFQICPAAHPAGLDGLLVGRGYRSAAPTAVQTTTLPNLLAQLNVTSSTLISTVVAVSPQPSPAWWACYAEADEVDENSVAARKLICAGITAPTAYAIAMRDGRAITVGSTVATSKWVGFFNIATLREHRRSGAALAIMASLSKWGNSHGAERAYLQVMTTNEAALRLYETLSFTTGYYYHYREQVV